MNTRFAVAAAAALTLSLTACGGGDDKPKDAAASASSQGNAASSSPSQASIPITVTMLSQFQSLNAEAKETEKTCADVLGVNKAVSDPFLPLKDKTGINFTSGDSWMAQPADKGFQCGQHVGENSDLRFFFLATADKSGVDKWVSTLKDQGKTPVRVDAPNGITVISDAPGANSEKAKAFMKEAGQRVDHS